MHIYEYIYASYELHRPLITPLGIKNYQINPVAQGEHPPGQLTLYMINIVLFFFSRAVFKIWSAQGYELSDTDQSLRYVSKAGEVFSLDHFFLSDLGW